MKVKTKKLLALLVTMAMCMGLVSVPVMAEGDAWSNNADITWYTGHETDTEFTLSTGAQLAGLAQLVNGGNSFEGKTIKLGADIDLDNKEWTPIGNTTNGFNGNFYGQNKTIKNLVINQSNMNAVGLFGTIQSLNLTYLKDLTAENVNITGSQSVGAVVGMTRSVRCENIKVTGNINITGQCYVGGVVGTSLSSNVYNITVEGTGSVNSITGTYVKNDFEGDSIGGVVGFYSADNNGYLMDKINVSNVTVTGTRKIGGVVGSTHIHNALTNIKVSNVTVGTNAPKDYNKASTMGIGGIVGLYEPGNNQVDGKLENASVSDITLENTTNKENASFGYITGGARGIVEPTLTGGVRNITVNGANAGANNTYLYTAATPVAKIGTTEYATLAEAVAAVESGQTIVLLDNLTQDDGVKFDRVGVSAKLDLNGKTFTVNTGASYNNRAIRIDNGTLEVYGGSIVAVGSGTTSSNGAGCYGAFRIEANGKLVAHDLTLSNARPWGLNVKVLGGEATLTNVTINSSYGGGIEVTEADLGTNSKPGKATLTNCTFTQTGYFDHCSTPLSVSGGSELTVNSGTYTGDNHILYVFSSGGDINVNGGTFTDTDLTNNDKHASIVAAIDLNTYPQYTGGFKISDGNFVGNYNITSPASMSITGGKYSDDPSDYVATGYEAVGINEGSLLWQVGKVKATELTPAAEAESGYEATYTATKSVVDSSDTPIVNSTENTMTVNVKTVNNTVANTEIGKFDLGDVVSKVVEDTKTDANEINVEIAIERDNPAVTADNTITYEVHPVATTYVNDTQVSKVVIGNDALTSNASFIITLPVPSELAQESKLKVTHKSEGHADEVGIYDVKGDTDKYVEVPVTHFSTLTLSAVEPVEITDVDAFVHSTSGLGNIRFITTVNSDDTVTQYGTYFATVDAEPTIKASDAYVVGDTAGKKTTFGADIRNIDTENLGTTIYAMSFIKVGDTEPVWSAVKGASVNEYNHNK